MLDVSGEVQAPSLAGTRRIKPYRSAAASTARAVCFFDAEAPLKH
jgi:hypothetical protein